MLKMILKSLMSAILGCGFSVLSLDAQTRPSASASEAFRYKPCSGPWINFAYAVEFNRSPVGEGNSLERNATPDRNGSWSSYKVLRDAVVTVGGEIADKMKIVKSGSEYFGVYADSDGMIRLSSLSKAAAELIGKDVGSLVGLNGSNFSLKNNPANVVANGGNNIFSARAEILG